MEELDRPAGTPCPNGQIISPTARTTPKRSLRNQAGGSRLIHGDLTGNVLFVRDEVPAVIDFSPYWRPPVFAEAIVVADGLLWFDLPSDLLTGSGDQPDWQQMLIRALIFRLVAHSESAGPSGRAQSGERERYVRATEVVVKKLAALQG
ncbi:hypothetical protein [Streptomyces sp. NPDC087538]|uniref:hypothetical protein n=1 Tax=Streptomyces sp. NPDC087538 TaxID=3365797 RepID=UPI0038294E9B